MGFIRLIHHQHYDPDKKRFKSLAFKPSSNNTGISVINTECIIQTSGSVCEHIQIFYAAVAGAPPIFWNIPIDLLPEGCSLDQHPSSGGDDCHYNLTGLTEKQARDIFIKVPLEDFNICLEDGEYRP